MMIFDVRLLTSVVVFLLFCGPSTIFAGVLQPKTYKQKRRECKNKKYPFSSTYHIKLLKQHEIVGNKRLCHIFNYLHAPACLQINTPSVVHRIQ